MTMELPCPIQELVQCPDCGVPDRLVVAGYAQGGPVTVFSYSLECEGCWSVVVDPLSKADLELMGTTNAGLAILQRRSEEI